MPQYELNLRDYWQIVQKRRGIMLLIFFAVVISTVIYTNLQKPIYRAVATVQWQESKPLTQMLTEMVMVRLGDPLVSQARIIKSQPVLEKAVIEAGLVGKDASSEEIDNLVGFLKGEVSTEIIPNTNIIRIYVIHEKPKMAAQIANKVTEAYIWRNLEDKLKEVRQLKQFVEGRLSDLEIKLKSSEEALANFKEKEVPSGIAIPLQNRLADLESKKSELLRRYTEIHPEVKEIEGQISMVKEQLKQMPEKELEYVRFTREVEIYTKFYQLTREKLEIARVAEVGKTSEASLVDPADVPTSPISPNKRLNYFLGTVIGLMLGLAGTFVVEQLDTSIGTIEDVESYLKLPALGIIPYLRTEEEKKRGFIQRLLAHKELQGKEKILRLRNQLLIHYSSSSPVFEAYRILRTNIQNEVFKEKMQGRILLFSSSGPEEGKSITISNLAIVMAQGGLHTLLIDADMRRSSIHKIFGLRQKEPGLCDILNGTIEPKEAIRTFTDILMGELGFDEALKIPGLDNLNILTGGSSTTNPAELISSAEMATLLVKLKEKFDLILVDSPPVLAVADPAILAPKTDGIILVYRVGKTARSVILRAKTQLIDSGVSVKGVILNNISPEIEMRYGYYYQYKYYGKYYGEKKEET